jgi:hypothetical protein
MNPTMSDDTTQRMVEAGVAAAHDDYAIRMGLPVRYADQSERGKKLARSTWEPRVRACLSAALAVAEADGVVLARVPEAMPVDISRRGKELTAHGHNACRAATLAGKVAL